MRARPLRLSFEGLSKSTKRLVGGLVISVSIGGFAACAALEEEADTSSDELSGAGMPGTQRSYRAYPQ